MCLTLMYITNNPEVALIAENYGVDRIWIDLETLGKEERQKGMNTVKSRHSVDDIRKIKPLLTKAELLVRVNPWNSNSKKEIEDVIAAGADMIMLPMWKSATEVRNFLTTVDKRCKTTLLLETKEAVDCLNEVLADGGMDEIHIGLNDLHISYGLTFMFELLANGIVEELIKKIRAVGIPCGFGGIASLGKGDLPAERVIMEHYRMGSTRAILSRSFCNTDEIVELSDVERVFKVNMKKMREFEYRLNESTDYIENQREVRKIVKRIVDNKKGC